MVVFSWLTLRTSPTNWSVEHSMKRARNCIGWMIALVDGRSTVSYLDCVAEK
jgi:hypothetical protein